MTIEKLLSENGRTWQRRAGASPAEIARLVAACPYQLPPVFIELLQVSNGGEGELGLAPRLLVLDSVDEIISGLGDAFLRGQFSGYFFFGGNGGIERIALDCRQNQEPFPVVIIDPIAGPDSAEQIAPDATVFVMSIGLKYTDGEQDDA